MFKPSTVAVTNVFQECDKGSNDPIACVNAARNDTMSRWLKLSTRPDALPPWIDNAQLACASRCSACGFVKVAEAPTAWALYRNRLPCSLNMRSPSVDFEFVFQAVPSGAAGAQRPPDCDAVSSRRERLAAQLDDGRLIPFR